jgi:GNAT superfamily N-acetyltransferase
VDAEPRNAFNWNGFGFICIDAVRNIDPIGVLMPGGLHICPMQVEDVEAWLPMQQGVNIHLASSPAFKPDVEHKTGEQLAAWLDEPGHQAWIALKGKRAVGYIQCEPVEPGAAWVVQGEGSFAVNGAFVYPEERASGIAKALLSTMMLWARDAGMRHCSVDFEATNLESCNFWLRHFQPVCVSMVRRLDERILPIYHAL